MEQTLAGQGERLKGYTVAVEVFGRPPDFDAQSDPLVRVEAGRLRRRLIEYYAGEGRSDAVRIELPRGSYAVVNTYHDPKAPDAAGPAASSGGPMPDEAPGENDTARNRRRWRRIRSMAVVAALAVGVTVILWQRREVARLEHDVRAEAVAGLEGRPPIVVQAFEVLGGADGVGEVAAALTEEVLLVLDGHESLVVPAVASGAVTSTMPGYVLSGSVREMDAQVRVTARVGRAEAGTQLWTAAYDEPLGTLRSAEGQRRIARLIALAAQPYGPIFEAEVERMRTAAVHVAPTHECVLRFYEFRRVLAAAGHAQAVECFELATRRQPDSAEGWGALALLYTEAYAHGFAGQGGSLPMLEKARETARRAMDIDGRNLHANLALASVQYFSGANFLDVTERILATWPENAEAQAYLGALFVLMGETARGRALVESAFEWTPQAPSGLHATRALAALREQRYDDALASALRIDSLDWSLGHLILAATGALAGRADLAARARARLIELDPAIAESLPDVLRRWRVEPALAAELERGFAAAAQGP